MMLPRLRILLPFFSILTLGLSFFASAQQATPPKEYAEVVLNVSGMI